MEEEGRDSQGETPIPSIILPTSSIAHDGAVAHQIQPTRKINCPNKYTVQLAILSRQWIHTRSFSE